MTTAKAIVARKPSSTARHFEPRAGARYKLVYLARRNPALAAADFPAAWRAHSQLASSFGTSLGKHFVSSHQCVKDEAEGIDPSFANTFDGSTILGMKSWPDLLAARYHPHALDELQKDEARVFAGPVDDWTMAVEEHELREGPTGGHVLLSFLTRSPRIEAKFFLERSRAEAEVLPRLMPDASRLVWNRVVDPAPSYPFSVVIEAWFPDAGTAARAAADAPAIAAFEQRATADPARGARLFARLNLAKTTSGKDGETSWAERPA